MLTMDKVHSIRQLYYEQGKNIPAIIAETGYDRKTICKYIDMTDFNTPEPKVKDPENICPKLDNYKPLIDEWLAGDRKAPRKQRHTAKRVFHRLRKEVAGFDCSYRLVAQYVAYRKSQLHLDNKKGYLPLIHHPGEGQADFGAAQFYENGRCHDGKYLVLSFPYSNGGYPQLMYGENAECFMESMIAIFEHIGGVPTEIWFDNTSTIVTRILKNGGRELTDKFLRFSEHYGFSYRFMNPESGWEKGNVENKVGYSRRNFLVPVPHFTSLYDFNQNLLAEADADMDLREFMKDHKKVFQAKSNYIVLEDVGKNIFIKKKYKEKLDTYDVKWPLSRCKAERETLLLLEKRLRHCDSLAVPHIYQSVVPVENTIEMEYIDGRTIYELMSEAYANPMDTKGDPVCTDMPFSVHQFQALFQFLYELREIKVDDLSIHNIICRQNKLYLIDFECVHFGYNGYDIGQLLGMCRAYSEIFSAAHASKMYDMIEAGFRLFVRESDVPDAYVRQCEWWRERFCEYYNKEYNT